MPTTYLPSREAELVTWAQNFTNLVEPDFQEYGITEAQGLAIKAAFDAFHAAYQTANDPTTRSPTHIETKNTAKKAMIVLVREVVRIIQAFPGTTDTMRRALGITVADVDPTPVPAPEIEPQLDIVSAQARRVTIRLRNKATGERRKPAGVQGAAVLSFVGDTLPESLRDWTFEGNTTKADFPIDFGTTVPMGAKVWITAFWYNRRAESGPACPPVATHLGFGALTHDQAQAA